MNPQKTLSTLYPLYFIATTIIILLEADSTNFSCCHLHSILDSFFFYGRFCNSSILLPPPLFGTLKSKLFLTIGIWGRPLPNNKFCRFISDIHSICCFQYSACIHKCPYFKRIVIIIWYNGNAWNLPYMFSHLSTICDPTLEKGAYGGKNENWVMVALL